MDNICFIVAIRSRICQSGVPLNSDKTYTNILPNADILLSNGYILTLNRSSNDSVKLNFINNALNLNFSFVVSNNSTNIFDIPIDSGTMRLAIFVSMRCCTCC